MVQLIPAKPTFGQRFGETFQPAFEKSMERFLGTEAKKEEAKAKTEAIDLKSLEQNKTLTKFLGKDYAEFHSALNTGEQTKFFEEVMKAQNRGKDPSKLLSEWIQKAKKPTRARPGVDEEIEGVGIEEDITPEEIRLTPTEEVARKAKQEERAFQRNKDYLERISKQAQDLPKEKLALQQMKGALDDENLNSLQNVIAEMTGAEWLKSASAQVLNSASKQFLLSSLSGITGRPNQFLEQSITKALVSPLYRKEANQLIYEGLVGLHDLKQRQIEITEALEEEYILKGEEPPRNFQKLVREKLQTEARAFEKEYENRVRELLSSKDDHVIMISPDGKRGSIPKDQVPKAIKKGFSRGD